MCEFARVGASSRELVRVRARSIIGTRYRSTTSTRGVSSAVSGGVSSGVSSGVRKGEGLGERLCEFVRVGASSRELAGVRARSITSTRCCSTYGHFAQPMDILLNLWTFCSTYGHSAPPIDTLLDLWTMCGPNRWPGAPDPTGGRPLAAGGAPQDALARRSGRTPWRLRNR